MPVQDAEKDRFLHALEQFRKREHLTKKQLATKLGVSYTAVKNWYLEVAPGRARRERLLQQLLPVGDLPKWHSLNETRKVFSTVRSCPIRLGRFCRRILLEVGDYLAAGGLNSSLVTSFAPGPPDGEPYLQILHRVVRLVIRGEDLHLILWEPGHSSVDPVWEVPVGVEGVEFLLSRVRSSKSKDWLAAKMEAALLRQQQHADAP